ncbi:MAG: hypothetical protein J5476_01805 [Lachnospiraceae bacterium]|nr:hypothetical protein [Lachnospiraceae bacterium]
MNKKILKILTGVSAFAAAGVLSVIPATNVFAGQYHGSTVITDRQIDDITWTIPEEIPADILITYSGNGSANVEDYMAWASEFLDHSYLFAAELFFDTDIPEGTTGNIDFDFVFDGVHYRGSAVLNESYDRCLYIENFGFIDLSSFIVADEQSSNEFYISINNTVDDISKAAQGINHDGSENPQKVVFYNYNGAINYRIINALAKTQGVTLLYTFEYKGYVFTSAITSENAANIILENEDWYGSCYIAQNCPTALVGVAQ